MGGIVRAYWADLISRAGRGWNLFWFLPARSENLSLLRLWAGVLALWWHFQYSRGLLNFIGPNGAISTETLRAWTGDRIQFSYFNLVTSPSEVLTVHWFGGLVLLLFTLGLFTRLTTLLSFTVIISYVHRAPMLNSEFEPILVMLLLYLVVGEVLSLFEQKAFTPLAILGGGPAGAAFSVDAWLARRPQPTGLAKSGATHAIDEPLTSTTIASRLIQVHLAAIYLMNGLTMLRSETWWIGEAAWWLISRPEEMSYPLASRLDSHPWAINLWTHTILAGQLLFPVLVWSQILRPLMLLLSGIVWLLVGLAAGNWLFALMMFGAGLAFVSPEFVRGAIGSAAERRGLRSTTIPEVAGVAAN
jgi:hypothetical protein